MTDCVLLVYGSRALNDTDDAREWGLRHIANAIDMMPDGSTVLSGGCPDSPDAWARDYVLTGPNLERGLTMLEFRLDGFKWRNGEPTEDSWLDLAPPGSEKQRGTTKWPLRRNDAMAMAMLRAHRRRWLAGCLGLRAPWSETHGTDYMTEQLKHDVPWSVISCPANLGPPSKVEAMYKRIEARRGKW